MSIATWSAKFYPVAASRKTTRKQALKQSIRKWSGLDPVKLAEHGVAPLYFKPDNTRYLVDSASNTFEMNDQTCALCAISTSFSSCDNCPLYESRGETPCFRKLTDENISPWAAWTDVGNHLPMLEALKKAKDYV